jgi:hypothetical protein
MPIFYLRGCKEAVMGTLRPGAFVSLRASRKKVPRAATSFVGARSELIAAVDLMSQGYEVFRALDPCASCDLITIKGNEIKRIQVRTVSSHTNKDGIEHVFLPVNPPVNPKDKGRQDRYAYVHGSKVTYKDA